MKKYHYPCITGILFLFLLSFNACQKNIGNLSSSSALTTQKTTNGVITPDLSTTGIGGYDLKGVYDQVLPFDFGHTGDPNFLLCYRPGTGIAWLLEHNTLNNTFVPIYKSTGGIGGYNLLKTWDLITTFDYDHSGRQDYLAAYRPGNSGGWNTIFIIKNDFSLSNPTPTFDAIVQDHDGIGGVPIDDPGKVTAFDYEHSGKLDYLFIANFYSHTADILKNNNDGTFTPVFHSSSGLGSDPFAGVYSLYQDYPADDATKDILFAFDYNHNGLRDHIVHCYNANSEIGVEPSYFNVDIFIDENNNDGTFTTKTHVALGASIPYSLAYEGVQASVIPFDYEHSGRADYLLVAQPNPTSPRIYIFKNNDDGTLTAVYQQINGFGLGGWDFKSLDDHIISFDYDGTGKLDYLFVWRGGTGICSIIKNTNGVFTPVL